MKVYSSIDQLVGRTPLLELKNIEEREGLKARIFAKLERFNPAGSAKDRAALFMINDAERRGVLKKGGVIIEPTSGNTGIGLSAIGVPRGYRVIIVMPDSMSKERILTMEALGAEVVLTPGALGMSGAIAKAEELSKENPGSFIAGQFDNKANALAHFEMTAPEIWDAMDGELDYFVAGVGTGGTITGCGQYFKSKGSRTRIVAVEPAKSPLLSEGCAGPHGLQGIGANFVPSLLDQDVYDEIIKVDDEAAFEYGRLMGKTEGILVGITSGADIYAAVQIAKRPEAAGKNIVAFCTDMGERYLSSKMFQE